MRRLVTDGVDVVVATVRAAAPAPPTAVATGAGEGKMRECG